MSNGECDPNTGLLESEDVRTGFVSGATFRNRAVQYAVVDGYAVFEGCIVLGTVEEMEAIAAQVRAGSPPEGVEFGVGRTGQQFRWPNGLMPYTIDANLPNQQRISDAMAHWESNTAMRFVVRTSANSSQHPNWVHFRAATGCWSQVGMRGGEQEIGLASGCGKGSTIHEIGHAFGLWHEQSREDRDTFIQINWQNIRSGKEHNFNQHISDGDDYGAYNYGSIMHYGGTAFSKNNQPTIVPLQSGAVIGQRNGLSAGDISTIAAMYGTSVSTSLNNVTVERTYATPASQNAWARLAGIGWRKIKKGNADGVSNMLALLCGAVGGGRTVNVTLESDQIVQAYLN